MAQPPAGALTFRRATPNAAGALDALYLAAGQAWEAPVARIEGDLPPPLLDRGARRRLRLFHFNDLHHNLTLPDPHQGDSHLFAQIVRRHRAARRAAGDDEIVLLLSGGDDHTGTVLDELLGWAPTEFEVDAAYAAYSAAGVDAAALGNHELDRGAAVLGAGIRADAAFPILSANLFGSRHLEPGRDYVPAAIAVARGLRIGLVGLITPVDTRTRGAADPDLDVASPLKTLANLLPALAARCDALIVMSHCGYGVDSNLDGKAGSLRRLDEGDIAIARAAARLTDRPLVVMGAHTHTVLNENGLGPGTTIDGIPIVQAGGLGSHVGEFEMAIRAGAPRGASAMQARLHPLRRRADGESEQDYDAEFERRTIAPLVARVRHRLDEVLALNDGGEELSPAATLRQRYAGECALANFVADALVLRSAEFVGGRVDLAIVNSTAIGDGLVPGRKVTFKHWYAVMPFADALQTAELTGAELRAIVANNAARIVRPEELAGGGVDVRHYVSRGFLHFSSGLRYAIRLAHSPEAALSEDIAVGGRALADGARYRVAFTNYVGAGGYGESWNGSPIAGGVPGAIPSFDLRPIAKRELGLVFRNEIVAQVRAFGRIGPATGARLDGRLALR
ncbi:MAG: 5'-nucleotidase C-terminal domain-containing protein [Alphaproteobacteria bacterium]|nr:5'-nucleotidase C-terminal domain-containing protein [Alphaproteobacteria bacterium]